MFSVWSPSILTNKNVNHWREDLNQTLRHWREDLNKSVSHLGEDLNQTVTYWEEDLNQTFRHWREDKLPNNGKKTSSVCKAQNTRMDFKKTSDIY